MIIRTPFENTVRLPKRKDFILIRSRDSKPDRARSARVVMDLRARVIGVD